MECRPIFFDLLIDSSVHFHFSRKIHFLAGFWAEKEDLSRLRVRKYVGFYQVPTNIHVILSNVHLCSVLIWLTFYVLLESSTMYRVDL